MKKIFGYISMVSVIVFFFVACARIPTLEDRKETVMSLFSDTNILQKEIKTSSFTLFSMQKLSQCENKDMKVYIEGDGLAWVTRNRVSNNPTPIHPIGFSLMQSDNSQCKVYLARPCQYTTETLCESKYWTSHRFNSKIIQSFNEALNTLKSNYKNSSFSLVGYSGGGAVAALTAAQCNDVSTLITVAGNLDTDKWVNLHHVAPLLGSLNPADFTQSLENVKQYHLIGENDEVIPKEIFLSFFNKFENQNNIKYFIYKATHNCCWEKYYKDFLEKD